MVKRGTGEDGERESERCEQSKRADRGQRKPVLVYTRRGGVEGGGAERAGAGQAREAWRRVLGEGVTYPPFGRAWWVAPSGGGCLSGFESRHVPNSHTFCIFPSSFLALTHGAYTALPRSARARQRLPLTALRT